MITLPTFQVYPRCGVTGRITQFWTEQAFWVGPMRIAALSDVDACDAREAEASSDVDFYGNVNYSLDAVLSDWYCLGRLRR